jgi:hypothetical protein
VPACAVPESGRVDVGIARQVVTRLGGRYSRELGIDVDRGEDRAETGARHLGLLARGGHATDLDVLADIAAVAVLDRRDLESGLVLAHHGDLGGCPGGHRCMVLVACEATTKPEGSVS